MPRKKKNGHSPGRVPGQPSEQHNSYDGLAFVNDSNLARGSSGGSSNFGSMLTNSSQSQFHGKDEIVKNMQEMFSHLDPEVIYIVLSEADFKVEHAMDSLLELSVAAEGAGPVPPPVSGFEMAAALLGSRPSESASTAVASEAPGVSTLSESEHLTADFDTLIDQELESIILHQNPPSASLTSPHPPSPSSPHPPSPSHYGVAFPLPKLLPELLDADVKGGLVLQSLAGPLSGGSPLAGQASESSSLVGKPGTAVAVAPQEENSGVVNFSHLTGRPTPSKPPLDLAGPSRHSAFQAYQRQPDDTVRGDSAGRAATVTDQAGALSTSAMTWNTQAPEFCPRWEGPTFVTPVLPSPTPWSIKSLPAAHWLAHGSDRQPPLKPTATIPKSWAAPPPQPRLRLEGQVLVLLRGAPGSGKSTLASAMLGQNPGGAVLSTDDFFSQSGWYHYDPNLLGEAHEWNHSRAKGAFEKGQSPVIIDNTNMQCWEMKPYVSMALRHKYKVLFREPDTWWKAKPRELERRTKHGVTKEKIRRMLERYDRHVTVHMIMCSQTKPSDPPGRGLDPSQAEGIQPHDPSPFDMCHPDIVRGSGSSLDSMDPNPHLLSSLPDVSSVSKTEVSHTSDQDTLCSMAVSALPSLDKISETSLMPQSEILDSGVLDQELDSCFLDSNGGMRAQSGHEAKRDPPSPEEEGFLQQPVAFSKSIAQRVRRDRRHRGNTRDQPLNSDPDDGHDGNAVQEVVPTGDGRRLEQQDFEGDWPSESLAQRERRGKSSDSTDPRTRINFTNEHEEDTDLDVSGPKLTEFQKLLDLLQRDGDSQELQECNPNSRLDVVQQCSPSDDQEIHSELGSEACPTLPDCVLDQRVEAADPFKDGFPPSCPRGEPKPLEESEDKCELVGKRKDALTPLDVSEDQRTEPWPSSEGSQGSGGPVELDGGAGEVIQERRKGLSRRTGKSCRLALTFTNQNPSSSLSQLTEPPPACPQSPDLAHPLVATAKGLPPVLAVMTGTSTQTVPKDFALLWRLEQQKYSELMSEVPSICDDNNLVILEGKSSGFVPKGLDSEATMTESCPQQEVPYRVVHEKSSQVEEEELMAENSKQQNLEILSRHFKRVGMDTLADLYEKCYQDVEWTTNLLLDSGERFFRDDDDDDDGDDYNDDVKGIDSSGPSELCKPQVPAEPINSISVEQDRRAEAGSDAINDVSILNVGVGAEHDATDPSQVKGEESKCNSSETSEGEDAERAEGVGTITLTEESMTQHELASSGPAETERDVCPEQKVTSKGCIDQIGQLPDGGRNGVGEDGRRGEENGEEEEGTEDVDAITQSLIAQLEEMERREEEERARERREREVERRQGAQGKGDPRPLNIQMLELKLPTELALQLMELYGPVGISPGEFCPDDCAVRMDLNLARLLHKKWKETIQERHKEAAQSYLRQQESSGLTGADGCTSFGNQSDVPQDSPFMDHWLVPRPHVSLREIMYEERALQNMERSRLSRWDGDKKDGAAILKEQQLLSLFPSMDGHFLKDIFRDHSYSLEQTEQFLRSLLDDEPVKNVVAADVSPQRSNTHRAPSKDRWKVKEVEAGAAQFQDTEDPEYEDFRAEARLQGGRQHECLAKAAEAYRQGCKEVASFYAQQARLHGDKKRDANSRAALQIFQRVNATLLPKNILDLHGLHVEEALRHLRQVLADKTAECQQGLCRPQLSIITGRGNHSQGGVARIRPAVLDYLKNQHYSFSEPKIGLILVNLLWKGT